MGDRRYVQIEESVESVPSLAGCHPVLFAMSNTPARGYRLVVRVVLLQAGCALIVASVCFACRGFGSGVAALAGGMIVAVGSAVFGWRAFAPGIAGAATLSRAMYAGVGLKWLWFGIALYVAFARLKLDAAPLLIGMVAAQLGQWVALMRLR